MLGAMTKSGFFMAISKKAAPDFGAGNHKEVAQKKLVDQR
jgi:hypothetical protein